MNRAYFVCGPESSGNRFMVSLLADAGCTGIGSIDQPIDGPPPHYPIVRPTPLPELLAFYRSFPHGGSWPSVPEIVSTLRNWGYQPTVLVMLRDQWVTEQSQVRAGHVANVAEARQQIDLAHQRILAGIVKAAVPFILVAYARLGVPEYRAWLTTKLDLPHVPTIEWIDENQKYYA